MKLVLSVGATPTTTSIRNLLAQESALTTAEQTAIAALRGSIQEIKNKDCEIELHAGVSPVLDVQQLATHALSSPVMSWSDLAFTIMAEVASIYPGRGKSGHSEVLIAAGSLALGREPCKAYSGGALCHYGTFLAHNTLKLGLKIMKDGRWDGLARKMGY
jgi:D-serine deaminase-like pyridoxal phosphate-dependent protein